MTAPRRRRASIRALPPESDLPVKKLIIILAVLAAIILVSPGLIGTAAERALEENLDIFH